jgi:CubicO group peptidase (beta-lactamase class C family)
VDQGRLSLDRPLTSYGVNLGIDDPRIGLITPRMVLSHTSGLPNEPSSNTPMKVYFQPGSRFSYSGAGFLLLQNVVEHVSGEPLNDLMFHLVFEPLKMYSSSYVWEPIYDQREARGYNDLGDSDPIRQPLLARAPSTLHITASDYARFAIAAIRGIGLSRASRDLMTHAVIAVDSTCVTCVTKPAGAPSKAISWGLGWAIQKENAESVLWHWGENNGDMHAFVAMRADLSRGFVILTNSGNGHSIIPFIADRIFGDRLPGFAWMGYAPYNAPAQVLKRDIVRVGAAKALTLHAQQIVNGVLGESTLNGIAYELLNSNRLADALAVFYRIVGRYPNSWNAHDSLAEALYDAKRYGEARTEYERSLQLNTKNENARNMIKKIDGLIGV